MSATRKDIGLNVRQWIERAQEDLRLSRHAMTMSTAIPYRLVAYHAQQCAEKCLKAYLVAGLTDFPYTHKIGARLELCAKSAPWIPKVSDAATLSSYATTVRYPGGENRVTKREAVEAIAIAERVLRVVTKDLRGKKMLSPRRN